MTLLTEAANALSTIGLLMPLVVFSILSFWQQKYILFLITAAVALITGLETPDIMCGEYETSWLSMTIGIVLIYIYTPACIGWAIRLILLKNEEMAD